MHLYACASVVFFCQRRPVYAGTAIGVMFFFFLFSDITCLSRQKNRYIFSLINMRNPCGPNTNRSKRDPKILGKLVLMEGFQSGLVQSYFWTRKVLLVLIQAGVRLVRSYLAQCWEKTIWTNWTKIFGSLLFQSCFVMKLDQGFKSGSSRIRYFCLDSGQDLVSNFSKPGFLAQNCTESTL